MSKILNALFALSLSFGISASEEKDVVYQNFADDVQVIDVRTDAEFNAGHLPQALHIPHNIILEGKGIADLDKTKPVVLYCRSGNRAQRAKNYLEAQGFTDITNAGGIRDLIIKKSK